MEGLNRADIALITPCMSEVAKFPVGPHITSVMVFADGMQRRRSWSVERLVREIVIDRRLGKKPLIVALPVIVGKLGISVVLLPTISRFFS